MSCLTMGLRGRGTRLSICPHPCSSRPAAAATLGIPNLRSTLVMRSRSFGSVVRTSPAGVRCTASGPSGSLRTERGQSRVVMEGPAGATGRQSSILWTQTRCHAELVHHNRLGAYSPVPAKHSNLGRRKHPFALPLLSHLYAPQPLPCPPEGPPAERRHQHLHARHLQLPHDFRAGGLPTHCHPGRHLQSGHGWHGRRKAGRDMGCL